MARTAVITGGTGGLGTAVISTFLETGWRVVAPVRAGSQERLPAGAEAVVADLTSQGDVEAAIAAAGPHLSAVVNLVGGYAGGGRVHETAVDDFEAMIRTNVRPTFLVTRAALPVLVANGGGSVVCVSSRAAVAPFPGAAGYVTAKAAVLAFANAVAVEYKGQGVRCNTVLPSVIDTPANRNGMPGDRSKWVNPAEIAKVILFLAGDDSTPMSGATIPVYGQA
ncbi:SDR family NAD(P)-dependent oxidoreductase [Actinoplanes sp. NPDC089786]|uniref:SDR family NAD(P)-dependent oxidoreductase n=1 Tax=Actinoplanes sp. NPDC089786 TaxID=3155185 RepID=UPI00342D0818